MNAATIAQLVVVALVGGGLVAGIAQLVTALVNRGKAPAERNDLLVSTAERVVKILRAELDSAIADAAAARAESVAIRERCDGLERRLEEAEHRAERAEVVAERLDAKVARRDARISELSARLDGLVGGGG